MTESLTAKSVTELDDLQEDVGRLVVPEPYRHPNIAFLGVFHGEGYARLDKLYSHVRPWFGGLFIALQEPSEAEIAATELYTDNVLIHEKFGFCEPSFNPLIAEARGAGYEWFFNLDGDELADLTLLASLRYAIEDPNVQSADGARFIRRNTIALGDGNIVPAFSESMARLFRTFVTRPPIPHSDFRGTRMRPHSWSKFGGIRHHRSISEFVKDQVRYAERGTAYSSAVSADYLATMFAYLSSYLGKFTAEYEIEQVGEMGERALSLIHSYEHPEETWKDWKEDGLDKDNS